MIEERTRKVFYSPSAGRCFFTKRAAINAEAKALILKRYPTEPEEYDGAGGQIGSGWHWTQLPRSDVYYRRVIRMVKNSTSPNVQIEGQAASGLSLASPC